MFDNMGQAKNQKDVDAIVKRKPGNPAPVIASGVSIGGQQQQQMMAQAEAGSMIQSKQGTGRT